LTTLQSSSHSLFLLLQPPIVPCTGAFGRLVKREGRFFPTPTGTFNEVLCFPQLHSRTISDFQMSTPIKTFYGTRVPYPFPLNGRSLPFSRLGILRFQRHPPCNVCFQECCVQPRASGRSDFQFFLRWLSIRSSPHCSSLVTRVNTAV